MILSCPECSSKFRLDSAALGTDGRKVRCSSCRHVWLQLPEEETTEIEVSDAAAENSGSQVDGGSFDNETDDFSDEALSGPPPLDDDFVEPGKKIRNKRPKGFAPDRQEKKGRGGLWGWLLLLLVLGGLGYGFWFERILIVSTVPEAMKLYALVDLEVEFPAGKGLEIENQKNERATNDGKKVIVVSGDVKNITGEVIIVPKLIGALLDQDGRAVSRKTLKLDVSFLAPNETTSFSIELVNSSKAVLSDVRFISDEEALQIPDFEPLEE
ncbi:zinc-ribbon domain-containing protein [Kiloniella laminariae]|uniref:zinc-ribbon domain-containing protein n=1 Tax=Kiloniella laminariae TaxID=454162 RepID=UPI000380BCD0|nr:zinc-ribbon domain-containing protein [Kiloniella laminariae]